ncbi:MAG: lysylphosphatidylglycerol synthase transmembrane domain-containing protein [Kofleriaceae bacterium]
MKIRVGFVLRVLGTVGGLAFIATRVSVDDLTGAFRRVGIPAFSIATALVALNVVAAAIRWRVLMAAYGASAIPRWGRIMFLYFVSFFYNNYLPGAVAGDVGRGIVTREAFADEGAAGSLAVVLVERALGLFGLFALLALGILVVGDRIDTSSLWLWTLLGSAGSIALVIGIAIARRIARFMPRILRPHAEKLPVLRDARAFAFAVSLSVVTQVLIAAAGWVLLAALWPIDFASSLLVVPLAAATVFLPITVGGAGAREAVYIALCGTLFGMPEHDAVVASLSLWFAHLTVGLGAGIAQLAARKKEPPA